MCRSDYFPTTREEDGVLRHLGVLRRQRDSEAAQTLGWLQPTQTLLCEAKSADRYNLITPIL